MRWSNTDKRARTGEGREVQERKMKWKHREQRERKKRRGEEGADGPPSSHAACVKKLREDVRSPSSRLKGCGPGSKNKGCSTALQDRLGLGLGLVSVRVRVRVK